MTVRATHVVRVRAFEAEDDALPVVDANRMVAGEIAGQGMQSICWRNLQVVQPRDGINPIELPPDDRPEAAGNLADGAIPDVSGRVISDRWDHPLAKLHLPDLILGVGSGGPTINTASSGNDRFTVAY